eukprot:TRINITY_DN1205_c0_g1_i1.p1 TRINITY_DN1205_c0_g1~~TRINITY_DN1205_c0_g1_i1.p1  ORF type:complete len:260 (+),score=23.17 TRINITY_DN1205_c0_g1_i1:72-851(+)
MTYSVLLFLLFPLVYICLCLKRMPSKSLEANVWILLKDLRHEILSLILRLLHIVYKCYLWALWSFRYRSGSIPESPRITQLPTHIGLAFVEPELCLPDVASLLEWIHGLGISLITLYDIQGELKSKAQELYSILDQRSVPHDGMYSFAPTKGLSLRFASHRDGKGAITEIANDLLAKTRSKEINHLDINEKLLHSSVCGSLPDPDLLIRIGGVESNMGFYPWHIRLTEIFDLYTHKGIQKSDFISVLYKYSRCEQRFGA